MSFLLQIIAGLFASIWGGCIWDTLKDSFQNSIVFKKGQSAVRSLSLIRGSVKSLRTRNKESASKDEINNLLSLLEKDVANATQEWHDIVPGITQVEGIYTVLSEKEDEVASLTKTTEQLDKKLKEDRQLDAAEKEELKNQLRASEVQKTKLLREIQDLKSKKDAFPLIDWSASSSSSSSYWTIPSGSWVTTSSPSSLVPPNLCCKKCNKPLTVTEMMASATLCSNCQENQNLK